MYIHVHVHVCTLCTCANKYTCTWTLLSCFQQNIRLFAVPTGNTFDQKTFVHVNLIRISLYNSRKCFSSPHFVH